MQSTLPPFPRLLGSAHFPQWKRRMMAALQDKDYGLTIAYHLKSLNPLDSSLDVSELKLQRTDTKARGLIEMHVGDSVLKPLIDLESAHEYWVRLHDTYQNSSMSSIVYRLRGLIMCQQDAMWMQGYIGQVQQKARSLEGIGMELGPKLVTALIVCNMNGQFSNVATARDAMDLWQGIGTTPSRLNTSR